jgi:hypothetical protein
MMTTRAFYVVLLSATTFDPRWMLAIMQSEGCLPPPPPAGLRLLGIEPEVYAALAAHDQLFYVLDYLRMWQRKLGVVRWRCAAEVLACLQFQPLLPLSTMPFIGHLENELRAARETYEYRFMLAELNAVAEELAWYGNIP